MFAKRNSITLAALWLILLIIGVFWYINDTRNRVAMRKEQGDLSLELKASQKEIKRLVIIEKTHSELSQKWLNSTKKIYVIEINNNQKSTAIQFFTHCVYAMKFDLIFVN